MELQDKIMYCRKRLGLSQEALAEQLGVSRQAVSKWETGEATPELGKLRLLAQTFGVTADWLLSDEAPPEPSPFDTPPQTSPPYPAWVDRLPDAIGKLFKRFGWLFGVYTALAGLAFTVIGALARIICRAMFQNVPGMDGGDAFGGLWDDGFAVYQDAVAQMNRSFATQNPVYHLGTALLIVGLVLIAAGVVAAILLHRYSKK